MGISKQESLNQLNEFTSTFCNIVVNKLAEQSEVSFDEYFDQNLIVDADEANIEKFTTEILSEEVKSNTSLYRVLEHNINSCLVNAKNENQDIEYIDYESYVVAEPEWQRYLIQVDKQLQEDLDDMFGKVLDEMEQEGLLTKRVDPKSGETLYKIHENQE